MWLQRSQYVAAEVTVCGCRGHSMWLQRSQYVAAEVTVCDCRGHSMWLQRSQYVAAEVTVCGCNGERSSSSPVVSGVPQGSVLGPLLFLVYINDVSKQVHSGCLISIFADDILMHLEIGCVEDYDLLQENIEDVSIPGLRINTCF